MNNNLPPIGTPGYGAALIALAYKSSPPVENSAPSGASDGKDGQGACTVNKNPLGSPLRDKTGLRYVRKGCTVKFYGAFGRVVRVRKGQAYVDWAGGLKGDCIRCAALEVVAL